MAFTQWFKGRNAFLWMILGIVTVWCLVGFWAQSPKSKHQDWLRLMHQSEAEEPQTAIEHYKVDLEESKPWLL